MFQCSVRGCSLNEAAHARKYDHIEETVGRRAAEDFEAEHTPVNDHDLHGGAAGSFASEGCAECAAIDD